MTSDQEFGSPPPDGGAPASDPEARDAEPAAEPVDEPTGESAEALDAATTLSPAVRRLVRQYDLDVTGIHGTGPSGRIRVGDVMALLAGRTGSEQDRESGAAREAVPVEAFDEPMGTPYRTEMTDVAPAAVASAGAVPITTVFECDLSRVLSHRKQRRQENAEALLTSYYIVACGEALKLVPEAVPPKLVRVSVFCSTRRMAFDARRSSMARMSCRSDRSTTACRPWIARCASPPRRTWRVRRC